MNLDADADVGQERDRQLAAEMLPDFLEPGKDGVTALRVAREQLRNKDLVPDTL